MNDADQLRGRAEALLRNLASRARARPGLFPVRDLEGFMAVIGDRLGWQPGRTLAEAADPEELSAFCEVARELEARPEDSHHWFALSQLRRGFPPLSGAHPDPIGAERREA
ncbi:MAG: hypothetical protein SNJ84_05180 [Verrucomicrobiia bacterium]